MVGEGEWRGSKCKGEVGETRMGGKREMIDNDKVQCLKNTCLDIEGGVRVKNVTCLENNNIEM